MKNLTPGRLAHKERRRGLWAQEPPKPKVPRHARAYRGRKGRLRRVR